MPNYEFAERWGRLIDACEDRGTSFDDVVQVLLDAKIAWRCECPEAYHLWFDEPRCLTCGAARKD